jgi:1,4-alpha-glucan branching enzyme
MAAILLGLLLGFLAAGCLSLAPRSRLGGPIVRDGQVVFRYFDPSASRVQVAGDWMGNAWARGDGPAGEANVGLMSDPDGDGLWELALSLPPGRYRYLFWVDEDRWELDPGNPEWERGGPVGRCSVILVREGPRGVVVE